MTGDRLVAIGEALIDFIPSVKGVEFDEVDSFLPATGGAPANVAGAYAALGGRSVLLTKLGNDPFGNKIIKELGNAGIDTSYILQTDEANTALAFVSLAPDGNTLMELIGQSSQVFIMGHKNADLDAVGAAMGISCMCRKKGTKAYIVIDRERNAANQLIDEIVKVPEYAAVPLELRAYPRLAFPSYRGKLPLFWKGLQMQRHSLQVYLFCLRYQYLRQLLLEPQAS